MTSAENIKQTALFSRHLQLGAKMVPFAGYSMPIQYAGILQEHRAVRSTAGLFDVSHMGEFIIRSDQGMAEAQAFLQRMTINDVSTLETGQAQYSAMCYENGGIVDDLLIYRYPEHFMVVVNASNIEKDFAWMRRHCPESVSLADASDDVTLIALQGPKSRGILREHTEADMNYIGFYHFVETDIAGHPVTLARTGYTGELGFEIYGNNNTMPEIWDRLMETGKAQGLEPAGLGARDTLRLEMKYCLYGNDIDDTTHPLEAGLKWVTKLEKGDFLGKEALLEKKESISRRLVCFEMQERGIPRQGYRIFKDGEIVGEVTSGGQSPSLNKGIGLGYVNRPYTKSGTEITIEIRRRFVPAIIVKPPFYKEGSLHN